VLSFEILVSYIYGTSLDSSKSKNCSGHKQPYKHQQKKQFLKWQGKAAVAKKYFAESTRSGSVNVTLLTQVMGLAA